MGVLSFKLLCVALHFNIAFYKGDIVNIKFIKRIKKIGKGRGYGEFGRK